MPQYDYNFLNKIVERGKELEDVLIHYYYSKISIKLIGIEYKDHEYYYIYSKCNKPYHIERYALELNDEEFIKYSNKLFEKLYRSRIQKINEIKDKLEKLTIEYNNL